LKGAARQAPPECDHPRPHRPVRPAPGQCPQRFKHRVIGTNARHIRPLPRRGRFLAGLHHIFAQHNHILTAQNGARGFGGHKLSVVFYRHIQSTAPNQLPRNTTPGGIRQILPYAKSRQFVMGKLRDLIRQPPAQHIHNMHHAKALASAQHSGNHLLRGDGTIEKPRRSQANIAMPAGFAFRFFPKAAEQQRAATGGSFRNADHGFKSRAFHALLFVSRRAFSNAMAGQRNIPGAIKQQCARRQSISPRATDFLIPAFR
jgi:hypothetical protein